MNTSSQIRWRLRHPLISAAAGLTLGAALSAQASFGTQTVIGSSASFAEGAFLADIDGDGTLDALTASFIDDKIAWYSNDNGDGSAWTETLVSSTADGATSVVAVDLDCDGDMDVVSASSQDDKIAWYQNTLGDGTAWVEIPISITADNAQSVSVGDIDGDGDIDVISAAADTDTITWHENVLGDGTVFTSHTITILADFATSVTVADVDGDGDLDVLSASQDDDTIAWYSNDNGDGSAWTETIISTTADGAQAVVAIDFDRDGDIDCVSASANDDRIVWYESTVGNGSVWATHQIAATADSARGVAVADLDGDGDLDVASASTNDDEIAWYENTDGEGLTWSATNVSTTADGAREVVIGDVDGDGKLDLVGVSANNNTIGWYANGLSLPEPSYNPEAVITSSAVGANGVHAVDLDSDGDMDAISSSATDDKIAWYENTNGDGSAFVASTITTSADGARDVTAGDIDGDGDIDVISASSIDDRIAWYGNTFGDGSSWTTTTISALADGASAVAVGDIDGDGDLDVASASSEDDSLDWYSNDAGNGTAWTATSVTTGADFALDVVLADIDGDCDLDLVAASRDDNTISWFANTLGDGSVWTGTSISTAELGASSVAVADVDRDGDLDVFSSSQFDDTLAWHENTTGDGSTWTSTTISTTADGAQAILAVDLNRDGDVDVVAASANNDTIAYHTNDLGDGTVWSEVVANSAADNAIAVDVADIDGDGDPDILSASSNNNTVGWYQNGVVVHYEQINGCDVNDPSSLVVLSGDSVIGTTITFGADNPFGAQTAGATIPLLAITTAKFDFGGCGVSINGFGLDGGVGELLVNVGTGIKPFPIGAIWNDTGPAAVSIALPNDPQLIADPPLRIYVQAVMVDLSAGAAPKFGLTSGFLLDLVAP